MMTRTAILAAAALGAAIVATPSIAAEAVGLRYDDLNLATAQGQAELDRRIEKAARAACGVGEQRSGTRLGSSQAKTCLKEAKAAAHKQVAEKSSRETRGG